MYNRLGQYQNQRFSNQNITGEICHTLPSPVCVIFSLERTFLVPSAPPELEFSLECNVMMSLNTTLLGRLDDEFRLGDEFKKIPVRCKRL